MSFQNNTGPSVGGHGDGGRTRSEARRAMAIDTRKGEDWMTWAMEMSQSKELTGKKAAMDRRGGDKIINRTGFVNRNHNCFHRDNVLQGEVGVTKVDTHGAKAIIIIHHKEGVASKTWYKRQKKMSRAWRVGGPERLMAE